MVKVYKPRTITSKYTTIPYDPARPHPNDHGVTFADFTLSCTVYWHLPNRKCYFDWQYCSSPPTGDTSLFVSTIVYFIRWALQTFDMTKVATIVDRLNHDDHYQILSALYDRLVKHHRMPLRILKDKIMYQKGAVFYFYVDKDLFKNVEHIQTAVKLFNQVIRIMVTEFVPYKGNVMVEFKDVPENELDKGVFIVRADNYEIEKIQIY